MAERPIILCFVAVYLPGYRSGGPVRTIANFVDHLGDEFDIRIVTSDRDALDTEAYHNVVVDDWNTVGNATVFYASNRTLTLRGIARLMRDTPHDLLYVNSFFAFKFTALPLLARRFGLAPKFPCVIASRGEFSKGAISLKAWKKRLYMLLGRSAKLYSNLTWQASSEYERQDIIREFGPVAQTIEIAPVLAPKSPAIRVNSEIASSPEDQPLKLIFLSRISPKKNLDFLLETLCEVQSKVHVDIFGPLREPGYWARCNQLIAKLPPNVTWEYLGEVTPPDVPKAFGARDLFVFPTRGENYGHVVPEALSAGACVLISDQTPWQSSDSGAVKVIPLSEKQAWIQSIEEWAGYNREQLERMRAAAVDYLHNYLETSGALDQNRALFLNALEKGSDLRS